MSLLGPLFRPRAAVISTSEDLDRALREGRSSTTSGASVTTDSAMQLAAVWSAVRLLAESVAQLPPIVYRTTADGRDRAPDHPLHRLLRRPNEWQTGFEFRELQQKNLLLEGNGYALKTVVRGEIRELLPVAPPRVTVIQEQHPSLRVRYEVSLPDGTTLPVPAERMFHLRGLSFDGVTGVSPIAYHREAIGVGLQMLQYNARLFSNGAMLSGVLEHPGKLSKPGSDRLREQFDERYAAVRNAHKTLLLEEGMKFATTGMSAEDAQFLESRKYSVTEIASIFRVPPHMIGDLSRATFSNIEQQSLDFVQHSLQSWLTRWEERIHRDLIPERDQDTVLAEFLVDKLLRGDFRSRMEGYRTAVTTGWMNRNEVRRRENLNRAEGLDEFLTPTAVAQPAAPREPEEGAA